MNTIPSRASRTQEYDLEEDDSYYYAASATQRCPLHAAAPTGYPAGQQTDCHT